ncbi:protein DEK-like [Vigna unguiculata]|uniref:DEK-C domain-containing protein n=1 Tax=Vigna unguiculata TaxID=3917 RepID=A0A4D6M6F2_VIGUN|nr:protein DEK-like [Vigna unguiculata]QCD96825.1 hypothetical protein DEO72_LG6g1535 [Vigna unguiculata]
MATETLEDNQPPLHDDDDLAKPQPNPTIPDKDASEDAAKSEDANVEDKDRTDYPGVEEEEAPEKKEEIDEDEEDEEEEEDDEAEEKEETVKAKGRSKETPNKSKKSKKDAPSEKKDPVTPTSERPMRERKTVERFSVPSPAKSGRSSASKGFTIEKGRGTQLKDIPNVAFKLSKRKPDDNLHMLHTLLFGKKTKAHNLKRNIGQFSGYVWTENEDKQRAKIKERIDKFVKEKLLYFCDVLNIQINKANAKKEELSAKLLEFLESPHATTDILLADIEQKGKKRSRKSAPSKSPGEASTEIPAKKQKQTSQSGKKQKESSDEDEDDKAEISDAKDDSQEDEEVPAPNNESEEESKSEEEEEKPKSRKRASNKAVKESSVGKTVDKTSSVKKTSVKDAKSIEKTLKKTSKKTVAEHDSASASISKPKQPASKKPKTVSEKQDAKGKAASKKQTDKSSKALVKDQGKSKSNKKAKTEPTKQDMHAVVVDILKEVDFNTATLSDILRQLGTHFGMDLMHRKAEVKDIITDVINNMSDEEDEEEAENDDDADKDDDGEDDA